MYYISTHSLGDICDNVTRHFNPEAESSSHRELIAQIFLPPVFEKNKHSRLVLALQNGALVE